MTFLVSLLAEQDMANIWDYIAEDNILAADNLLESFYEAFQLLVLNPQMGYEKTLGHQTFRLWNVKKRYHIIYRVGPPLQIARVLNGYQDIFTILEKDS